MASAPRSAPDRLPMGLDGGMTDAPLPYRERLTPAAWLLLASALLLPAIFLILLPVSPWAGGIAAVFVYGLVVAGLFALSPEIVVADGVLRAGRASIPVSALGALAGFRGHDAFLQRGPELDVRAWLLIRGWVDPVLRVEIRDDADPTPYWLISTRRPEELAQAIEAARSAGAQGAAVGA